MKWRLRTPRAKAAPAKKSVRHYEQLHDIGPVRTVIDVGVGDNGSPFLYEAFPDAYFYSIDAVAEVLPSAHQAGVDGLLIAAACGAHEGAVEFQVSSKPSRTSIVKRLGSDHKSKMQDKRIAHMVRLDDLFSEEDMPLRRPVLLKVDVEGYERNVIAGAFGIRQQIDYVVLEISFGRQYESDTRPSLLIGEMAHFGFEVAGILKCGLDTCDLLFSRAFSTGSSEAVRPAQSDDP